MNIFIEKSDVYVPEIRYIWNLFCQNQGINSFETDSESGADFRIGVTDSCDLVINENFYQLLLNKKPPVDDFIRNGGFILLANGEKDLLSTAFFMVSCAQELGADSRDEFNRFPYSSSYQIKMGNYQKNLVQDCFDLLCLSHPKLKSLYSKEKKKSFVFISHDIDKVYGSILQDTFSTIRKIDVVNFFKCISSNIFQRPQWLNMERIVNIEKEFGFYSTFFWLPRKGKSNLGVDNADYNFKDSLIQNQLSIVNKAGSNNGIHKSISNESFADELRSFDFDVKANRYHFLAFNPHEDFIKIEESGLQFDSSLAYAESFGFRNNYALPYRPYLFSERRSAKFVECPLNIMDTTFYNYLKLPAGKTIDNICNFIDENKSNSVISLLWHNNFISDYKYKDYCVAYSTILSYLQAQNIKAISPVEIIKTY